MLLTVKQLARLRAIKKGPYAAAQIKALAGKMKKDGKTLYNKWFYEVNKKPTKRTSMGDDGDVMMFKIDTSVLSPTRCEHGEVQRMQRGLALVIDDLKPNGGSISIPNKLASQAKKYLDVHHANHKFTYSRVREGGKETGWTRIFKRS